MRRLFPILATAVGLLLVAGFYLGLIARGDDLGRGARLAGAAAALAVHASAFGFLRASGRRVESIAGREGLPGWVGAQAEKNRRKSRVFEVGGALVAISGAGLLAGEWWSPIVSGSSVSFQIGSFLGESMIVAGQSRLLESLSRRASPGRSPGAA